MTSIYQRPPFLSDVITQKEYKKWLDRKVIALFKRDLRRDYPAYAKEEYRKSIHKAVCESGGRDAYTGREMRWDLIKKYNNADAKREGKEYRKKFADLPTVDHVSDKKIDFKICSWVVNDIKSDLNLDELIKILRLIEEYKKRKK